MNLLNYQLHRALRTAEATDAVHILEVLEIAFKSGGRIQNSAVQVRRLFKRSPKLFPPRRPNQTRIGHRTSDPSILSFKSIKHPLPLPLLVRQRQTLDPRCMEISEKPLEAAQTSGLSYPTIASYSLRGEGLLLLVAAHHVMPCHVMAAPLLRAVLWDRSRGRSCNTRLVACGSLVGRDEIHTLSIFLPSCYVPLLSHRRRHLRSTLVCLVLSCPV